MSVKAKLYDVFIFDCVKTTSQPPRSVQICHVTIDALTLVSTGNRPNISQKYKDKPDLFHVLADFCFSLTGKS